MKLTLDALKGAGSFTGRPVEKEIKWRQNGTDFTATVYVRPLGYQTAVSDVISVAGKQDSIAGRIAASICDEHGNPVFSSPLDITHGPLDPVELEKDPESTKRLFACRSSMTQRNFHPAFLMCASWSAGAVMCMTRATAPWDTRPTRRC